MKSKIKAIYTESLCKLIEKQIAVKSNTIFVFTGISDYINIEDFSENITDYSSFEKEGNSDFYNREWFGTIFAKLMMQQTYQILSHQQFAYISEYLAEDFFKDRALIVYDNLRSLFPIHQNDYLEGSKSIYDESNEERPENLPIYHAEQMKIGNEYYYSLRKFNDLLDKIPFFSLRKDITECGSDIKGEILDVISNPYAIDGFVNSCLKNFEFNKNVFVKISEKNILNKATHKTLKELNHLLSKFKGGIYFLKEESIKLDYTPQIESTQLLKQYWGHNAEFRNIHIYENPEVSNNIIPVSQGLIVDTIINEYKNGCKGITPRDIFITAPTGAGKSLIFQLPAFYAANNGDVTIVVSPLKALMTDQVEILHRDRKYDRVEFLNSDLSLIERDRIVEDCKQGNVDILYLSPELLLSYDIHFFIGERKLGLVIVDEAHLITTWGRDFRVDYWFLGNHINKIRKYNNYLFPLVALTATAVYGGVNDMVFDSINSLNMYDPHKFIGNVRRSNIEFVIDTHEDYKSGKYDINKEEETLNFIKGINELGLKSIIYAPYTKHITRLKEKANEIDKQMTVGYHGSMNRDQQMFSYQSFKQNQCKIMISTKAFGMGVDIPDIQVVYHHAPSGLLPDYIQEIGRAARKEHIHGFAALTFSKADLRYSKQLFGLSSLKPFQLQEVLKKIIRCYNNNNRKRNMLIATSDFAYIFDSEEELDQKVSTALMMIEKDYLIKTRFNVLIARPKKLFSKVFARTTDIGIDKLSKLYGSCYNEILNPYGNYHTIELNLEEIWSNHFSDKSFPKIKSEFYKQSFLQEHNIELTPLVKITLKIDSDFTKTYGEFSSFLESVCKVFAYFRRLNHFFTQDEFEDVFCQLLGNKINSNKLATFLLGTYSGNRTVTNTLEGDSFLQERKVGTLTQYQVFSTNYVAKISQLLHIFTKLFESNKKNEASRFLSINDIPLKNHIRIGSLLEILNLGVFETTGGDDPRVFIRINDPRRIEKDSTDSKYNNYILESVKNRHRVSCQIFEHFFINSLSNEKRWDLIEDFFLGMSNDELFEKYPGNMINHVDIIDYIRQNTINPISRDSVVDNTKDETTNTKELFRPKEGEFYFTKNLLTIGSRTMSVGKWISEDPITMHKAILDYNLTINKDDYKILMTKLRVNHYEYYRDLMGLKILIDFPGYSNIVIAGVPYQAEPVKFYKWWRKNKDKVRLSTKEKIQLLLKVNEINPNALVLADRKLIGY
jgi:RecQ family ATP-dependent DNA helicase